jgi:hypothetical protein
MPTPVKVLELTNKEWLREELKTLSPAQVAKKLNELHNDPKYCTRSSVDWAYKRYFTLEEQEQVKLERIHKDRIKLAL